MSLKKKKQTTAGGGLYIALAICVLSVICIGVYSAIVNIFDTSSLTQPPVNESDNGENKAPVIIVETPDPEPEGNAPVQTPPPDTSTSKPEAEPEQSVNVVPSPPTYSMPLGGGITKEFSNDTLVYSLTMNDYRLHNGVDLASAVGTQVKAFSKGVVKEIYEDPLMGQTVVLEHDNNTVSVYQNLSTALPEGISVGARVEEGQVIGGVGETILIECAEEPHLHFEVLVNGEHVDPMSFFQ